MQLRRIETPGIAHYAYLLADGGEAALFDPRRDVDEYLAVARELGVRIRYVFETHRHEDFVLGSTHLARLTGALVVNGQHEAFGRGDVRLRSGDALELGALTIRGLHTPGHTKESMSYAVYDESRADDAWGVFTGDTLFFGDTGRTDLMGADRAADNARVLYDSVHEQLSKLGDGTLVLPAHGPGSVCGSGMAALPISSMGQERRHNRVFTLDRDSFARAKASERLPKPPYFERMAELNAKGGVPPRENPDAVALLAPDAFSQQAEGWLLLDTREPEAYIGGHPPGAYSVWLAGLPIFGGWLAPTERPVALLCERDEDIAVACMHLQRIGIDDVRAALPNGFGAWRKSGQPIETSGAITPHELVQRANSMTLIDVRDADEFSSGHIPGAQHVYVGHLEQRIPELRAARADTLVVTCSVGHRAGLAVSILRRAGFSDVRNLLGGMTAWKQLKLPLRRGGES